MKTCIFSSNDLKNLCTTNFITIIAMDWQGPFSPKKKLGSKPLICSIPVGSLHTSFLLYEKCCEICFMGLNIICVQGAHQTLLKSFEKSFIDIKAFPMGLPKAKINSNIAYKSKKWLPMDELHVWQNRFLLHFQAIYALHCSFFFFFFFSSETSLTLSLSLFLFSFFCSAPWLLKPWESTILCHQPKTRSTMPIYLTRVAPENQNKKNTNKRI